MKKLISVLIALAICFTSFFAVSFSADASTGLTTPASTIKFIKGASNTLVYKYNGKSISYSKLLFSSSNKSVATVSSKGKVKAVKDGTATIKIKLKSNTSKYCKVKIKVLSTKTFYVLPGEAPLNGVFLSSKNYNSKTKNYYMIRSYLEYFESHGGCTLSLKAGTYKIPKVLYIPSNTKIKLQDGVVIKKTCDTGCSLKYSKSLFHFCAPSKANTDAAYSKYNGVHDSGIFGYGNATISFIDDKPGDLGIAVVMCHNKNITVKGVNFTNIDYGHFFELDASKNVIISNCTFRNQRQTDVNSYKECINIDTPDKKTGGFGHKWSSFDKTPVDTVKITNCTFKTIQCAIGTHMYSQDKYHKNITIENCTIANAVKCAIRPLNWSNCSIKGNIISRIGIDFDGNKYSTYTSSRCLYINGCSRLTIADNSFKYAYQFAQMSPYKLSCYDTTYNSFSAEECQNMVNSNSYTNLERPQLRVFYDINSNNTAKGSCTIYYKQ